MIEENLQATAEETTSQETEELDLSLETEEQATGENGEPDAETLKAEIKKLKETNAQLYKRFKEAKESKPVEVAKNDKSNSKITREEVILFAKGFTEEEVELANKLAKVQGVNPLVAAEDPYFQSKYQERIKKEQAERASLGASKNSGNFIPKDIGKMSKEEHEKLFHKAMGNVR